MINKQAATARGQQREDSSSRQRVCLVAVNNKQAERTAATERTTAVNNKQAVTARGQQQQAVSTKRDSRLTRPRQQARSSQQGTSIVVAGRGVARSRSRRRQTSVKAETAGTAESGRDGVVDRPR